MCRELRVGGGVESGGFGGSGVDVRIGVFDFEAFMPCTFKSLC